VTGPPDSGAAPPSRVDELQKRLRVKWKHVNAARRRSEAQIARLKAQLAPLVIGDVTCVVFGSLARLELTKGSDVDWTLLVDGSAAAEHRGLAKRVEARFREMKLTDPSPGGAFGNLTFSHDLVHRIGGDDDTNRNTTQRLLLLLESVPIGSPAAYEHVVGEVLRRYIEEDMTGVTDDPYRVPRFLQNDVVRYWRTMTVDFAHKRSARASGWALRTAKLRMSRKLMYTSGLLSCFSCELVPPSERVPGPFADVNDVVARLAGLVRTTPLDIVAGVMLQYFDALSAPAAALFSAYDEFLGLLNDTKWRTRLKKLKPAEAENDPDYRVVRELGGRFENALAEIFFDRDTPVRELTRRYGLF
jgi:predicted nucleotidyltransferase